MVEWKRVIGYEDGYSISSDGEVYSHKRNRLLTPHLNMFGYLVVKLSLKSKGKRVPIHLLLAKHFISKDNLEWMSREDNVKHGLQQTYKALSPEGIVVEFTGQAEFCRENSLTQSNFSKMLSGERPTCKGWKRAS